VPAAMVGRDQEIEIGPMSGVANVGFWLTHHGYEPDPAVIDHVFQAAKKAASVLDTAEVERLIRDAGGRRSPD